MTDLSHLTFGEVAALAPKHDPGTCDRDGCGKCKPKGKSQAPAIKANPHNVSPPSKPSLPKHLNPDAIATELEKAARAIRASGQETWARFHDWQPAPRIPTFPGPDDEQDETGRPIRRERSSEDERERLENAQAGLYWTELAVVAPRLYDTAVRMTRLVDIANIPNRKGSVSNLQGCELCTQAGLKEGGKPIPFDHHSNVGERLSRDMYLCQPHYLYVQRHDHAPTAEQTRHWSATGTWKVKTR